MTLFYSLAYFFNHSEKPIISFILFGYVPRGTTIVKFNRPDRVELVETLSPLKHSTLILLCRRDKHVMGSILSRRVVDNHPKQQQQGNNKNEDEIINCKVVGVVDENQTNPPSKGRVPTPTLKKHSNNSTNKKVSRRGNLVEKKMYVTSNCNCCNCKFIFCHF